MASEVRQTLDGFRIRDDLMLRRSFLSDIPKLTQITFEQLNKIVEEAWGGNFDWNDYEKDLRNAIRSVEGPEVVFTIEARDNVIGYIWLKIDSEDCVWLTTLVLEEGSVGSGTGSRIFNTIADVLRKVGKNEIQLGVQENNLRGLGFWAKLGFTKVDYVPRHHTLILKKAI